MTDWKNSVLLYLCIFFIDIFLFLYILTNIPFYRILGQDCLLFFCFLEKATFFRSGFVAMYPETAAVTGRDFIPRNWIIEQKKILNNIQIKHIRSEVNAAIFALQEKMRPGMIIFRGQCVDRLFRRQLRRGSHRKAAYEAELIIGQISGIRPTKAIWKQCGSNSRSNEKPVFLRWLVTSHPLICRTSSKI